MSLVAASLILVGLLSAQQPAPPPASKQPPANPTNLKILKTTSGAEVIQIMHTFTAGLGVQCTYCHVAGNYASDENHKNLTARKMIGIAHKMNTEFQDGK